MKLQNDSEDDASSDPVLEDGEPLWPEMNKSNCNDECKVDEESNINDDDSDQNVCRPLIASKTTEHFLSVGWP